MASAGGDDGFELALETSGRFGSVALGGARPGVDTVSFSTATNHASQLMPTIEGLCRRHGCAPADLRTIHVSGGPGSFTGLRVGITTARMLALALGVRLTRVPTLEVIAQNALRAKPPPPQVAVLLDAKRGHVYAATFELRGDYYEPTSGPIEADPAEFLASPPPTCGVLGEGIAYHRAAVERSGLAVLADELARPEAAVVLALGRQLAGRGCFESPRDLVPIYVRRPEAEEKWELRHGH